MPTMSVEERQRLCDQYRDDLAAMKPEDHLRFAERELALTDAMDAYIGDDAEAASAVQPVTVDQLSRAQVHGLLAIGKLLQEKS